MICYIFMKHIHSQIRFVRVYLKNAFNTSPIFFRVSNDPIPSPRRNIVSAIEQIASFYTAGFRITKTINMIVPTGNLLAGISANCDRGHNLSVSCEQNSIAK